MNYACQMREKRALHRSAGVSPAFSTLGKNSKTAGETPALQKLDANIFGATVPR
jgi:hypothetical protein